MASCDGFLNYGCNFNASDNGCCNNHNLQSFGTLIDNHLNQDRHPQGWPVGKGWKWSYFWQATAGQEVILAIVASLKPHCPIQWIDWDQKARIQCRGCGWPPCGCSPCTDPHDGARFLVTPQLGV